MADELFIHNADYFGEWWLMQNDLYIPDGRGIIFKIQEMKVYFGQIKEGMRHGTGRIVSMKQKDSTTIDLDDDWYGHWYND